MSDLLWLELSVVLWFVYLFTQILTSRAEFGDAWLFTPRDESPAPKGLACGRARRALANYLENYAPFIAVDLALIATQHAGGYGPAIWVIARFLYLPAYVLGWLYLRTALWGIAIIGLLMMLARLAGY
ncbi:MAG: hypothetical protein E7774_06295 [Bradyrhizobium sp.]|nr:MAG: hypothetical protein E7774_06295 [Bradyrhizobium sp.]